MILVLSDLWLPFPGGAERLIFNLARYLQQSGERVEVLTSYEPAQQFDGPPVWWRPIGIREDHAAGAEALQRFVHATKPSLVLTHHFFAFEFEEELRALGIPVVQVVLNNRRLDFASFAVFISEYVRRERAPGWREGDMVLLPPAFDDVIALSHGDGIGFIKPIEHKGVDLVYEVAKEMPDRRFVILRGEWQNIETIVEVPNVEFMEPVDDIREFYAECRIVLMPSKSEDAGTVAQECALNGIPCISSDVDGIRETNAGGMRIQSRDPRAWVAAINLCDRPEFYAELVASQSAHLRLSDQEAKLDEFVARVRALL